MHNKKRKEQVKQMNKERNQLRATLKNRTLDEFWGARDLPGRLIKSYTPKELKKMFKKVSLFLTCLVVISCLGPWTILARQPEPIDYSQQEIAQFLFIEAHLYLEDFAPFDRTGKNCPNLAVTVYYNGHFLFEATARENSGSRVVWDFSELPHTFYISYYPEDVFTIYLVHVPDLGGDQRDTIGVWEVTSLDESLRLETENGSRVTFTLQGDPYERERFILEEKISEIDDQALADALEKMEEEEEGEGYFDPTLSLSFSGGTIRAEYFQDDSYNFTLDLDPEAVNQLFNSELLHAIHSIIVIIVTDNACLNYHLDDPIEIINLAQIITQQIKNKLDRPIPDILTCLVFDEAVIATIYQDNLWTNEDYFDLATEAIDRAENDTGEGFYEADEAGIIIKSWEGGYHGIETAE